MTSGLGLEGLPDLASFLGLHERHLTGPDSEPTGFLGFSKKADNWCLKCHLLLRPVLMTLFNDTTPLVLPVPLSFCFATAFILF